MNNCTKTSICALAIGFGLLTAAAPAFAQTMASPHPGNATRSTGTMTPSMTPSMAPTRAGSSMTGMSSSGPNGSLEQYHGMFRASELNGANVYDEHGTSIGTVNDMLLGSDGRVQNVVLSVGGFLGVGTHYVSVPYSQLQVQPSRAGMTAAAQDTNAMHGTASGAAPVGNNVMSGSGAISGMTGEGRKQYFSVVLPGATRDTLKNMPEFRYVG